MLLPELTPLLAWRAPENLRIAARYLIERLQEHDDITLADLSRAPHDALRDCAHVTVRYASETPSACQLAGYYHHNPPTITLHRSSTDGRDNFTVLHEFAHHLQQHDEDWALGVLAELTDFEANILQERVCDAFASAVLFPDDAVSAKMGTAITAKFLADLHRDSSASRSACCMKAIEVAPAGTECLVVYTDASGAVLFARSNSDSLYVVPFGSVQEDFARLFEAASARGGQANGIAQAGLRYSSGQTRDDLNIDLALDWSGIFAFAVVTPLYKFGEQTWQPDERECNSGSCGALFSWTADIVTCPKCGEPRCPDCSVCGCEKPASTVCPVCFMELSVVESGSGMTTHVDCA